MPSLSVEFLENLYTDYKSFPCFVETGTYLGDTIFGMEPHFEQLYTIEIKEEFFDNAKGAYHGNKIEFLLGDSSKVLCTLCPLLESPTLFFLDGHWSAGDTGRGSKDCPLYEELEAIMEKFLFEAVVLIDDVRLFGKGPRKGNEVCDWESIATENILALVALRLEKHYFLPSALHPEDRMVLHLSGR
jgi:hypothetical protein